MKSIIISVCLIWVGCVSTVCLRDCPKSSRNGATCRDGWHSYSTGSGTCSGHGGVSCWDCLTSEAEDTTQVIDK